jgi:hypothetical protein
MCGGIGDPEDAPKGTCPPRKIAQQPKRVRPVFRVVATLFRFDCVQPIPQRFRVRIESESLRRNFVPVADAAELEVEVARIVQTDCSCNMHNSVARSFDCFGY